MNGMGNLSWYLGCAFERDEAKDVVKMTPTSFVEPLADRLDAQFETETPASMTFALRQMTKPRVIGATNRQSVVCLLRTSERTRLDVASAVRAVARHVHNPAARHWKAGRKMLAYLKAIKYLGVVFSVERGFEAVVFH